MSIIPKDQLRRLIKQYNLKDTKDIQNMLKDMFGDAIAEMLEAELEEDLGYTRYDYKNKRTTNSRNGFSKKKVRSNYGDTEIKVPRDRDSEFEPKIVKKNQSTLPSIEDQVLSMYGKGMTTTDIEKHLESIYGMEATPELISRITDKILPLVTVFMDAIHYKVRSEGRIVSKAAYTAIGVNLEGIKEVLGIWVGETESAKFWLSVLNEIKNRGVADILIISVDGLKGFTEAIASAFPETEVQKCILHQIRASTRYVSYKDIKAFTAALKKIYQAATEQLALAELERLEDEWGKKYPLSIKSWRTNWAELATFFKYPNELRRIIYTTNTVESFHRQLRKVTKSKSIFPNDKALLKMLYLATMDATDRWTMRIRDWPVILSQLTVYFKERVTRYVI